MSYGYVVEENNNYRVSVHTEEYAEAPDPIATLIRLDSNGCGGFRGSSIRNLTSHASPEDYEFSFVVMTAFEHYADRYDRDDTIAFVSRYLRSFWTFTGELHTYYSGESWYVSDDKSTLAEYEAWVEGDVYYIFAEKRVTEQTITRELDGTLIDNETTDAWEETDDTVGGFYGAEYAEREAKELFNALTQE